MRKLIKARPKWVDNFHKGIPKKNLESLIHPIELKDKSWIMTDIHKKIKHLNHTMIVWAEDNKYPTNPGNPGTDYVIPPRMSSSGWGEFISEWKDDLKFVTKLDRMLSDGETLTKKELQMCNELYEFYSKINMKSILRK